MNRETTLSWPTAADSPAVELAREELSMRIEADNLRGQIEMLELRADRLLERMQRIGQRSFYCGRLPR